jgi:hypothetical protein
MLGKMIRGSVVLGGLLATPVAHVEEASLLRVREDAQRDRLWVLRTDGVHIYSLKTRQRVRHVPLPGWHWAGEPYGCTPDLAIGPRGEALVTSDVAPVLWRIDGRTFAASVRQLLLDADEHMDIGFSSLVYSPQRRAYVAASPGGSVWSIDTQLTRARKTAETTLPCARPAEGAGAGSGRSTGR